MKNQSHEAMSLTYNLQAEIKSVTEVALLHQWLQSLDFFLKAYTKANMETEERQMFIILINYNRLKRRPPDADGTKAPG